MPAKTKLFGFTLTLIGVIGVVGVSATAAPEATPQPDRPTAREVLDRYQATQRHIYKSFLSRFESANEGYINQHTILEPGRRQGRDVIEIRSDGRLYFWCEQRSGQCFPPLSQTTPASDPRVKWFLYDGRLSYRSGHEPLRMIQRAVRRHPSGERANAYGDRLAVTISDGFERDAEFARQFGVHRPQPPTEYCGRRQESALTSESESQRSITSAATRTQGVGAPGKVTESLADLPDCLGTGGLFHEVGIIRALRNARTLELEPKQEVVGSVPCYVLRASLIVLINARGQRHTAERVYRLHFDPTHDYHMAKLETTTTHRDLAGTQTIKGPYLVEKQRVADVEFQKVGDAWVPMAWRRSHSLCRLDNPELQQWHKSKVRRTRMLVNPDHDALDSFKPAWIQDGWRIHLRGFGDRFDRSGRLTWKAGQIVDCAGRAIDLSAKTSP